MTDLKRKEEQRTDVEHALVVQPYDLLADDSAFWKPMVRTAHSSRCSMICLS
jgi:hypothetical protein